MQDFKCSSCQTRYTERRDYCELCGMWNTVSLDVRVAARPEPSILPAPTWSSS